jgi:hypothetical protein
MHPHGPLEASATTYTRLPHARLPKTSFLNTYILTTIKAIYMKF